ncbi:M20 family metallopeptidase [Saccharopolyspora sp. NPDC002376]
MPTTSAPSTRRAEPDATLSALARELDVAGPDIIRLSHEIHADPELGGCEFRATQRTTELLTANGFTLDAEKPSQPTAFSARAGNGQLVAALCIEYDALPEIGHGCGHNVNAAVSAGAAMLLAPFADQLDLTVKALGTPAEETTGGKVDLLNEGFFDDVHLALMAHAAGEDSIGESSLAMSGWEITYEGRAAHAATAPDQAVNALNATIIAQNAIGLLRQHLPHEVVVSSIVTEGGTAVNVVPDVARMRLEIRAPRAEQLRKAEAQVFRCLEAGALATGAELATEPLGHPFLELIQDEALMSTYQQAMKHRGRHVPMSRNAVASTDLGNVSHVVPSIQPMIGYEVHGAAHHTADFTTHGTSPSADQAVLDGAFALAATVILTAATPAERSRLLRRLN